MTAWLIYSREGASRNKEYINFYIQEGNELGIEFKLIFVEDIEYGIKNNQLFLKINNKMITKEDFPSFALVRVIYPLLSEHLEMMKIRIFNNSFVSRICNDKAKTYQEIAPLEIDIVETKFYVNNDLHRVMNTISEQSVIKAVDGHGGSQVFLYNPMDKNREIYKKNIMSGIGNSDFIVQPLIGSRNQDLRVYVIGKQIIASVIRTAAKGFRANFSLGGNVELYDLDHKEREIINRIINQFDFGLAGIDFIIGDKGNLIFNEIEDVVGSRMLYQCSNINIVKLYLEYIVHVLD